MPSTTLTPSRSQVHTALQRLAAESHAVPAAPSGKLDHEPVTLGALVMDASVRERLEYLIAGLKVARIALESDPELAERELTRCRTELLELTEFAQEHAARGGGLLSGVLREVERHVEQAETLLEERFVTA